MFRLNGVHSQVPLKKMVAKFDYDSRQQSPNADAEQTELTFKQGDIITIYGEMDEDGFYVGELNGLKGLVPSNFLSDDAPTHLMPSVPPDQMIMRKGVAFSDGQVTMPPQAVPTAAPVKKAPTRQVGRPQSPFSNPSFAVFTVVHHPGCQQRSSQADGQEVHGRPGDGRQGAGQENERRRQEGRQRPGCKEDVDGCQEIRLHCQGLSSVLLPFKTSFQKK